MIKIGLTGGIGCGKSTVTNAFRKKDILIIDADKIARELVDSDTDILDDITRYFGKNILDAKGRVHRKKLKQQIFSDDNQLKKLEDILHPRIRSEVEQAISEASSNSDYTASYIIVDIPLLIEKGYVELFDEILVVDCLPEQQIQRVQQRDEIELSIIQAIIDKQIDRKNRLSHANFILDNTGTQKYLKQQINSLHERFIDLSY